MGAALGALARPLLRELKQAGVQLMADTTAVSTEEKKVFISLAGQTFFVQADHIITAAGAEASPEPEIAMALMDERLSYAVVGDADHPADVGEGLESVFSLFSRFYLA